jgi:hypothetical protein
VGKKRKRRGREEEALPIAAAAEGKSGVNNNFLSATFFPHPPISPTPKFCLLLFTMAPMRRSSLAVVG